MARRTTVSVPVRKKNFTGLIVTILAVCLIGIVGLIGYFVLQGNPGSSAALPGGQFTQPPGKSAVSLNQSENQKELVDSDGDGMSDWFEENIAHLDPLTPNDRYTIIVNTVTIHPIPIFTDQRREEMTSIKTFLIQEERFKPENVFLFMDKEATYDNFKEAIDYLTKTSDENDLVYIMIEAHGSETGFVFHTGKDPSEIEIFQERLEALRKFFTNGDEMSYEDFQIFLASQGYSISVNETNELINKIEHKKMFLVVDSCGGWKLVKQLSGKNLVTATLGGGLSTFAIGREYYPYKFLDTDGNSHLSIKELFDSLLPTIDISSEESIAYPKMFDPQGIAVDFYFGDAKITAYQKSQVEYWRERVLPECPSCPPPY